MVGPMLFSRSLGNIMSKKNNSSGKDGEVSYYEEILEDDDEYYEEIIVDEDGEEYIEEIIYEDDEVDSAKRVIEDLRATQDQVDSMSLANAKQYLLALPNAKGPTVAPTTYSDDDYEYEEIELPDSITPIRKSRRFSLFDAPPLDNIEEGSEHSERSGASSMMQSPPTRKKAMGRNLTNITEENERSNNLSAEIPPPAPLSPLGECDDGAGLKEASKIVKASPLVAPETPTKAKKSGKSLSRERDEYLPEGTILVGSLNDQLAMNTESPADPPGAPPSPTSKQPTSGRSISRSNKSIQSEATETTYAESGSNGSLDIRQVFGLVTPPGSPHTSPNLSASRKRRSSSAKRSSEEGESANRGGDSSLGRNLRALGSDSGHSSSSRRRSGSRRHDDDDDDNRSTKSSRSTKSRRSSSLRGGRRSTAEDRAQSVEAEIMALLSPSSDEKPKKSALDNMLSSDSKYRDRGDSDNRSRSTRSSRSGSRRQSSRVSSSDKSHSGHSGSSVKHDEKSARSHESSSKSDRVTLKSPTGGVAFKEKPSLKEGSKTLDALLARIPSEPKKRGDAKSTASGILRSSRGRTRDSDRDRDCQSVVGGSSARPPRARSARRTKRGDDDNVSVASMSALGRKPRARSTSVGRKNRLRRDRRKDETEMANRKFQEEMRASTSVKKDDIPISHQSSEADKPTSGRSVGSKELSTSKIRRSSSSLEDDEMEGAESSRHSLQSPKSRSRDNDVERVRRSSTSTHDQSRTPRLQRESSKGRLREDGRSRSSRGPSSGSKERRPRESGSGSRERRPSGKRLNNSAIDDQDGEASFSRTLNLAKSLHDGDDSDSDGGDLDGNASFARTMSLARSLHGDDDDKNRSDKRHGSQSRSKKSDDGLVMEEEPPKTPTHRRPSSRASTGGGRSSGTGHMSPHSMRGSRHDSSSSSHVRKSPIKTKSADDVLLYSPEQETRKRPSRLSDAAAEMREAPKAPREPKDRRRDPLTKKHSSDDVLLIPEEGSANDLDAPKTPGGTRSRRPPSRSQSSRPSSTSSNDKHEHRTSYHSPRTPTRASASTSHSSSKSPTSEKVRAPPPRAQSEMSPRPETPGKSAPPRAPLSRSRSEMSPKAESSVKAAHQRHRRRSSIDYKSPSPASSFSSPRPMDHMLSPDSSVASPPMATTPTSSKHGRRSFVDMQSPTTSASSVESPGHRRPQRRSSMGVYSQSPAESPSSGSSRPRRRSSMDFKSPSAAPPLAPILAPGPTPFERLSELEKIKPFITQEEYEVKKKEILASL